MGKRKITLIIMSVVALLLLFVSDAALAGNYSSAGDPGGFNNPLGVSSSITDFLEAVMEHLQGIIAFLAVIFIVIGGILYMTAGGNQALATTAKICITGAIMGLAIAAAGPSFLRQIKVSVFGGAAAPLPTNIAAAPTLLQIATNTLTFLLSIAGILGIIGLTISGLIYIFAAGDSAQASKAKDAIKYSILGILLAGASLIIVRQIVLLFS